MTPYHSRQLVYARLTCSTTPLFRYVCGGEMPGSASSRSSPATSSSSCTVKYGRPSLMCAGITVQPPAKVEFSRLLGTVAQYASFVLRSTPSISRAVREMPMDGVVNVWSISSVKSSMPATK